MKMSQHTPGEGYVIRACEPGRITLQIVDRKRADTDAAETALRTLQLDRGAIIAGRELIEDWGPDEGRNLSREHLRPLLEMKPELVLLGTGPKMEMPALDWIAEFHRAGIGFDVMTTDAACRTYNILSAEGRKVVAAIVV